MSLSTAELAVLGSAFVLGLRHGVDYDHIAAITDITSSQTSPRRGVLLSTFYAIGHGLVVLTLGAIAVALSLEVPEAVDSWMGRAVGITLVALGLFVLYTLVKTRGSVQRLPSRGAMLLKGLHALRHALPGSHHHHARPVMDNYGPASCVGVGIIHGIGAETPSQLVLFVLAAGFTGALFGMAAVGVFVIGVLVTNTAMSVILALGYGSILRRPQLNKAVVTVAAVYTLAVGFIFVAGMDSHLPHLI